MGSLSMISSGIQLTHPGLLDTTPTFQRGIFEFFNLKNSTEFRATILNFKVKMWFLCSTCHSSFTKRANLKRHIKSAHLNVRFICDVCQSEFKRKEYLTRHMRSAHPCVTDVTQPEHKNLLPPSTSHWDPTSDFNLDNFSFPPMVESTQEVQPELQSVYCTDICRKKTASSQTDRSKPPRKLSVKHQHSSTSPILFKDRAVQEKPIMVSTGTSPHIKMQDYYVIPLEESPLAHSPRTPLMTPRESKTVLFEGLSPIQCYYTSEFRHSYIEQNGGAEPPDTLTVWSSEDPLPSPSAEFWN